MINRPYLISPSSLHVNIMSAISRRAAVPRMTVDNGWTVTRSDSQACPPEPGDSSLSTRRGISAANSAPCTCREEPTTNALAAFEPFRHHNLTSKKGNSYATESSLLGHPYVTPLEEPKQHGRLRGKERAPDDKNVAFCIHKNDQAPSL